jgi:uncharacterized protein (DUF952 family)
MLEIYHLVLKSVWEANPDQPYVADSLSAEGFIHCSFAEQVAWAANRFYADQQDLLVLYIDPARLTSPVREETSGSSERFPHVYGPINRDAVVAMQPLQRDANGRWEFAKQ